MEIDKKFIQILACPLRSCRGDLEFISDNQKRFLVCKLCGQKYPIIQNIPILFPNSDYSPDIHQRHWDLNKNAKSYASKYNAYEKKQGTPWGLYTHNSELAAIDKLVKKVNLELTGKTIVDAGCGNGRLLSYYNQAKYKIGLDTSLELLIDLKHRHPDYMLVCAQLEDMPFKDAVADFTTSIRVFQHIKAPEIAFAEMVRITKPNGYISLELYNKLNLKQLYKCFRMWSPISKVWSWGLDYDRYYSFSEIKAWCHQNFIKPLGWSGAGWGIHFYLFEPLRFRGKCPKFLQKIILGFFLSIEDIIGLWSPFNKIMEKICFIGSLQARKPKKSILSKFKYKLIRRHQKKQLKKFQQLLNERNYCYVDTDYTHLLKTINWLNLAQKSTSDSGISRGFSLVKNSKSNLSGWQPSYPETTGYIISTFIKASKILNDKTLVVKAMQMADWELNIMFTDGAVHGGNISMFPNKAIFDTGQVINGLIDLYQETSEQKYLNAAVKSADWIASQEYNHKGKWETCHASSVSAKSTTYYSYAIAPIAKLGNIINNQNFISLAERTATRTIGKQLKNGWFIEADFEPRDDYLLHSIAYTIDGLWDIGTQTNSSEFCLKAKNSIDNLLKTMSLKGTIPGRLDKNWQPTVSWICLTGIAQIGITCFKIFQQTNDKKYSQAASRMKQFLKTTQNNLDPKYGGIGAIYGSWPIEGKYGQYQALNWPAKFFADLLIYSINLNA